MEDTWLAVVGYEGLYEVSDQGNVRSVDRIVMRGDVQVRRRGKVLNFAVMKGYLSVDLCRYGKPRRVRVHTLVLTAFRGERPPGLMCCHGVGGQRDNRLENLRWDTASANSHDAIRDGTHSTASKTHCVREHKLVEPNLVGPALGRMCKACSRARSNVKRAAERGEFVDLKERSDEHYAAIMGNRRAA
jgi:hypothetical protein